MTARYNHAASCSAIKEDRCGLMPNGLLGLIKVMTSLDGTKVKMSLDGTKAKMSIDGTKAKMSFDGTKLMLSFDVTETNDLLGYEAYTKLSCCQD
ncbi:hypothetical protein ACLBWT_04380 [Paenibacillus sp. D51F]